MNLVTVCGHNTTMLYHMLRHYKPIVKNFFVNIYANYEDDPIINEATSICNELDIEPHKVWIEEAFNWNRVTEIYNETTSLKPNDWWIISDDDELQLYSKPIEEIIKECEENNWEFVTGGFLDRIGENGEFPEITNDSNVWKEMPNAGFFRYPLSRAEANKVTLLKGILCNWFVCLSLWQATCGDSVTDKAVGIFFPIAGFVVLGLEHCVANMYIIPQGMILGANITLGDFIIYNLIPVTLGNIISGMILVGVAFSFMFHTKLDNV